MTASSRGGAGIRRLLGPRPGSRATVLALPATASDEIGGKADGLRWLLATGRRVPAAWVVPYGAVEAVVGTAGDSALRDRVVADLGRIVQPDRTYAVRSSANVEDGSERSFAGQFVTRLDVAGVDALVDAVAEVGRSVGSAPVRAYAAHEPGSERAAESDHDHGHDHGHDHDHDHGPGSRRMAVIVQEQVPSVVAGVVFTRNPMTGLDETVVEAVRGSGVGLVQEGLTPDRWTHRWGALTSRPADPILDEATVLALIEEAREIAHARGGPVDLEWAWDGERVWWLQVRGITALDDVRIFSNRIAREVMPGLIPPLVWSVNVPVVNRAWVRLLEQVIGPAGIAPEDLARQFGYRAYFDMKTLGRVFEAFGMPSESLELLLGLPPGAERPRFRPGPSALRHVPRATALMGSFLAYGRTVRQQLPPLIAAYDEAAAEPPASLSDEALLGRVDRLMAITEDAAYMNIVTPILMGVWGRLLDRRLAAAGIDPATVDAAASRSDGHRFDPGRALDELSREIAALPAAEREALAAGGWDALRSRPGLAGVAASVDTFAARFGHLSASGNDSSMPTWREDPAAMLAMILAHEPRPRPDAVTWDVLAPRLPAAQRPLARTVYVRAAAFRVYRDAVSFEYTRGYGHLRPAFLDAGRRLVERGALGDAADVYLLTLAEVRAALGAGASVADHRPLVAERRAAMDAAVHLDLPDTIYGEDFVPAAADGRAAAEVLHGVPTSRGNRTGRARIVRSRDAFARVDAGDIVVVPHSDVGWTPLFSRAGAIVAESGGMLSHSSIVAREYGIPCVVSITAACALIPDGATVTVDGYTGTVRVAREVPEPAAAPA